jgi:DNA-directed RNA polymerase specialized sigma24 family protein
VLSQSPETWIAWVRLVLVQDGGLSYDDAEDGVTCILLFYHRRTGDYPWKETKPDVLLLRTLCHDYASAYWRKQKRRERLLDGWMPPSPESSRHLEAIAIGELCAQEFMQALSARLRAVARRRLQGDTCAEIAQSLGVSRGTAQAYLRDPRQLFKKFFGYDPTKRGSRGSNRYGKLDGKEGMEDENSRTDTGGGRQ